MANVKKLIALAVVVIGVFFYASQPTVRSLYSTKADASSEYRLIGQMQEKISVSQIVVPDNSQIQHIEVLVNEAQQFNEMVFWQLETNEGQVVVSGNGHVSELLNNTKNKLVISLDKQVLEIGKSYRLNIQGQIGGLFYYTNPRFTNQILTMNGQIMQQSLVAKVVYQGLHVHTFIVLLGLIAYIVLFMSVMLKLFR